MRLVDSLTSRFSFSNFAAASSFLCALAAASEALWACASASARAAVAAFSAASASRPRAPDWSASFLELPSFRFYSIQNSFFLISPSSNSLICFVPLLGDPGHLFPKIVRRPLQVGRLRRRVLLGPATLLAQLGAARLGGRQLVPEGRQLGLKLQSIAPTLVFYSMSINTFVGKTDLLRN